MPDVAAQVLEQMWPCRAWQVTLKFRLEHAITAILEVAQMTNNWVSTRSRVSTCSGVSTRSSRVSTRSPARPFKTPGTGSSPRAALSAQWLAPAVKGPRR